MRKVRGPTRLGEFILRRMTDLGMDKQVDLVRASAKTALTVGVDSGISDSTVSRLIYSENYMPDRDTLAVLAATLRVEYQDLVLFVYDDARNPATPGAVGVALHPRAVEVDRILASDSPVPDEDRAALEMVLDRILDPYRKTMRRKRSA